MLPPLLSSARLRLNGAGLPEVSQSLAARVLFSTHSRRQLSPRTTHNGTSRPSGVRAYRSLSTEPSLPSRPPSGRLPPPGTQPPPWSSARLRPSPGTDGGDSAEPPSLAELLSLDRTLSHRTTLPHRKALLGASTGAWSRGTLTLRPMPTTAMVDTDLAMGAMEAMEAMGVTVLVLATLMASKCQSCSRELQPLKLPLEQIDRSKIQLLEIRPITVICWHRNKIVRFQAKKNRL